MSATNPSIFIMTQRVEAAPLDERDANDPSFIDSAVRELTLRCAADRERTLLACINAHLGENLPATVEALSFLKGRLNCVRVKGQNFVIYAIDDTPLLQVYDTVSEYDETTRALRCRFNYRRLFL